MRREYLAAGLLLLVAIPLIGVMGHPTIPGLPTGQETDGAAAAAPTLRFDEVSRDVGFEYAADDDHIDLSSDSGVFAVDYNRDGWTDLLAIGGPEPVLFRNDGGEFVRSNALPDFDRQLRTAAWYDHDGDGWTDALLMFEQGPPVVLENREGRFRAHSVTVPVDLPVPMGAAIGDFDEDGCLDAFVIQNGDWHMVNPEGMEEFSVSAVADNGNPNLVLFGRCSFDSPFTTRNATGVTGAHWSLATSAVDVDGDGDLDVHVANDFNNDVLYLNRGNGTFERRLLGVETNRNGMSSEIADINRDGRPDLFVTNIFYPEDVDTPYAMEQRSKGNNLLINRGNGTFRDAARSFGVKKGGWGWGAALKDLDNDGDLDLFHATKSVSFRSGARLVSESYAERLHERFAFFREPALWERSSTSHFTLLRPSTVGFNESDGRGVATLDFDNDGDLDIALASGGGRFTLFENRGAGPNALQVVLESADRPVVGARVTVSTDGWAVTRFRTARTDFLSQDSRVIHVGLGNRTNATVRVDWPSGETTWLRNVSAGARLYVSPDGLIRRASFRGDSASAG